MKRKKGRERKGGGGGKGTEDLVSVTMRSVCGLIGRAQVSMTGGGGGGGGKGLAT